MLQPLGSLLIRSKRDSDILLAVSFVLMQDDDMPLLGLPYPHHTQVKTVGREPEVVADADRELAQQGFLACDTGTSYLCIRL